MTCNELNVFIKNYMVSDRTGTAIMLTAPWGFGKSYYIQESLKKFLEDNNYKCIVVSVYGLKSVQEISKQIYLSLRTIKFFNNTDHKSEIISTGKAVGKVVGKTILNAITTPLGLNIESFDDGTFQEVYESINLTDKLVVLEDIERSEIDIVDILGYVNNLTENDHVKVLLVANENELIKKEGVTDNHIKYSEKTRRYLKIKEKTISDTINMHDDQSVAISNILNEFNKVSKVIKTDKITTGFGKINLRTLKYACQKSNELLALVDTVRFDNKNNLPKFKESIFFGVLQQAISLSKNFEQASKWTGGKYYLGEKEKSRIRTTNPTNQVYLVFKFCFDYLVKHEMPSSEFLKESYIAYGNFCLYESNQTADDKDLSILKSFYTFPETDVKNAVINIKKRLENENDIPFMEYGNLVRILLQIKYRLGISIEDCKENLINNLRGKSNVVDSEVLFLFDVEDDNSEEHREYVELKEKMVSSLNNIDMDRPFGFDYNPENISELEMEIVFRNTKESFISKFDIEKIKTMIAKSSAKEIDDLRGLFFAVYRSGIHGGRSVYYSISDEDKIIMRKLIELISGDGFESFDKVQRLQLEALKENLTDMINS